MVKIPYNQITQKQTVILDDDPYIVIDSNISKKNRQKASNTTKLKNLRTGNVIERTFHQSDALEVAEMSKKTVTYLYSNRGEFWFCPVDNPRERFALEAAAVGDLADFIPENSPVEVRLFNDEIISVIIPVKVTLRVTETTDAVKGNTSSGATKEVTVETGYTLQAPQFINQGDIIAVNTETGQYTERLEKA